VQLTINIPFSPAYVSDHGIQPPVPQRLVTVSDRGSIDAAIISRWLDQLQASIVPEPQHATIFRPHRIADGHRVQRIAGLPLSFVEPQPRPKRIRWAEYAAPVAHLHFDEPFIAPKDDDRTPLDAYVPESTTLSDHDLPALPPDSYDGFAVQDFDPERSLPRGKHSRPITHDPADLERMADQILAADAADILRPTIATQKMDTPRDTRKPWPVEQRTSPSDWEYKPYTYTLGHKPCPRCHGNVRPFAQRPCRYCRQQGGWTITRTRMTPHHPVHGFALTPPRIDDQPVHRGDHWRTRGEYYGDVRRYRSDQRQLSGVYAEIRRRHFEHSVRRQLRALAVTEERHLIAA
jgi:hypothetical protein